MSRFRIQVRHVAWAAAALLTAAVSFSCRFEPNFMNPTASHRKGGTRPMTSSESDGGGKAEKTFLANGLTIVTREDHSAPVVSVQVWVRTGSMCEGNQLGAGLSHILEHMLFKGTTKRGVADIAREVEAHGGSVNAYTTWDRTVYHIDIPTDGGRPGTTTGLDLAMDILADAMMNSTLPPKEYLLEQKVILRELAMGRDNPDRQASELLFATAYAEHPSRHPVIGYEDVYRALRREDVMVYYKERYIPNNMVFLVVGDIQPAQVRASLEKQMGSWARRPVPSVCIPEEPEQVSARRVVEESRTASEHARLHLAYQTCDFRHADAAPLELLAMIAGHGQSSRLYQDLREKRKLVHEVDAWSFTPVWRGVFGASAVVETDKVEATRQAILDHLARFQKTRVSRPEMEKALKMALSSHLSARKTMSGQASELGSSELLCGDLEFSEKYLARLQGVTADDIQRVARLYFVPERLSSVVLLPKGSKQAAPATVGKVGEEPVGRAKLANGLTLLTREDRRLPFVELRLVMKSGLLFEEPSRNGVSQLAAKLLLKGTRGRSAADIVRQIESVGGMISTYSGANSMGISIEVLKSDLPLAVDVLSDIVRHSVFDEASIAREKEAQLAEIHQEREQPVKVAMQNARTRLFGAHPYHMPSLGTEKSLKAITREDLVGFWHKVAAPANMTLAVFGDVRTAEVERLVRRTLGALPGSPEPLREAPPAAFGSASRFAEKMDKEQAVVVIAYPGINLKSPDRPALEILTAALSGMGSRLFVRLRDQMALCYYVGVNEMIGMDPGFIYFYIGTEPAKAAEAEKQILAEIEKVRKEGITTEELERARAGLLGERKMQRQNLGDLALTSSLDELYGLGYDHAEKLDAAFERVTTAQVRAVAQKYLSRSSVVSVVKP